MVLTPYSLTGVNHEMNLGEPLFDASQHKKNDENEN